MESQKVFGKEVEEGDGKIRITLAIEPTTNTEKRLAIVYIECPEGKNEAILATLTPGQELDAQAGRSLVVPAIKEWIADLKAAHQAFLKPRYRIPILSLGSCEVRYRENAIALFPWARAVEFLPRDVLAFAALLQELVNEIEKDAIAWLSSSVRPPPDLLATPWIGLQSVREARVKKAPKMPELGIHKRLEQQACPKCDRKTLVCCHVDVGAVDHYDNYCHVCLDPKCDYGEHAEDHTQLGMEFGEGRVFGCPFCRRWSRERGS